MRKKTHMSNEEINFAKAMHDAFTVKLEEAEFLDDQIKEIRKSLDWKIKEGQLYEQAAQYIKEGKIPDVKKK